MALKWKLWTAFGTGAMIVAASAFVPVAAQEPVPPGQPSAGAPPQVASQPSKRNPWASPMDVISHGIKLKFDPVEPADLVRKSRPSELNYVPVGAPRPEPAGKLLTLDELRAREAELDSVRSQHDRLAHRPAPRVAFNPVAQEPRKKQPKAPVNCTITCQVQK